VHGGAGDDFITSDGTLLGEGGNDRLVPQGTNEFGSWTPNVYGGAGRDTFQIDYNSGSGTRMGMERSSTTLLPARINSSSTAWMGQRSPTTETFGR
jgi:hypothetical protein